MAFTDLRIGIKQGLGFGLILTVMAAVSIFAIVQMRGLRSEIDDMNEVWLQRAVLTSRFNLNAWALRTTQLQHAFAGSDSRKQVYVDTMLVLIDKIDADREAYQQLIGEAESRGLFSPEEEVVTSRLDSLWEVYLDHSINYLDLRDQEAVALLGGEAGEVFNEFSTDLGALVQLHEDSASRSAGRTTVIYAKTRNRIMILLAVTILLSGWIAVRLVRLITVPVRQLVEAADKVAGGDFSVSLDSHSKDEIGTLTGSFGSMTHSLKSQQEDLRTKNEDLENALDRLRVTQQQLILKEKMASLGQLTAGVAHEIRNPLNFVISFAELSVDLVRELRERMGGSNGKEEAFTPDDTIDGILSDLASNAESIERHGKRAEGIVRGMLDHSRTHSDDRTDTDANGLLEEFVNMAVHSQRAQHPELQLLVERDYDPAVGEVSLIPQEIGRVFANILNNAVDAVREKVASEGEGYAPSIMVATRRVGGEVEIRIGDNGPGIPSETQDKIFEPFFTTKPTGSGTGLGLSLSYDVVVQGHGGRIEVESEVGEGATFVVTLPAPRARS